MAKINLLGADSAPGLISGMSRGDVRHAMRLIIEQQELLLACWKDIHGRTL